jgi:Icc-related predicted phosphoesterase
MKIRLWSDVHNEFGVLNYKKTAEDKDNVLVIAGDFTVGHTHMDMLRELCEQFYAVVFTPGNHEYYHNEIYAVDAGYRRLADEVKNFYFLQGDYAIIDDVRFIGGTFWTDFNNDDPVMRGYAQARMNDYRQIKIDDPYDGIRYFTPKDSVEINSKQRKKFLEFLRTPFDGRTVIVTHHAPHEISIDPNFQHHSSDRMLNFAYRNSGLEEWFEKENFTHWFHGHIHKRQKHKLNGKYIIANPRGYWEYEAMAMSFDDEELIEI